MLTLIGIEFLVIFLLSFYMKRKTRFFIGTSILAILMILLLQLYWLNQFYIANKKEFERQVTLCFEEALKKEFDIRVDSITHLMVEQFLDTLAYDISSTYDSSQKRYAYSIADAKDKTNKIVFSSFELNQPVQKTNDALKRKIAQEYANVIKQEDLKNHFVINRLNNLGAFLDIKVKELSFDTTRLRTVLGSLLVQKKISTPFKFYVSYKDSINDQMTAVNDFPFTTSPYPTYKWWVKDEKYVSGLFMNPARYIITKMKWMIITSIALVLLAGYWGYLLFNAWNKEKKLSVIKDDFINNITHELKTPVTTISAAVEALSDSSVLEDKSKTQRYLRHSANELTKLDELINRILNISLFENQQIAINYEAIPVSRVLRNVADGLQVAAQHKKVSIQFNQCTDDCTVTADKELFIQCIGNILQNSIKYSGETIHININCHKSEGLFEISISDDGWGIDSSDLPFVFDKFYRGVRKDHLVKGHGLGLYNIKKIMEIHKGSIAINSKKNRGTTVYLRWPE